MTTAHRHLAPDAPSRRARADPLLTQMIDDNSANDRRGMSDMWCLALGDGKGEGDARRRW